MRPLYLKFFQIDFSFYLILALNFLHRINAKTIRITVPTNNAKIVANWLI